MNQFLEERRSGIGGSDIAVILGVSPFGRTRTDVAREKLGLSPPIAQTAPMRRGQVLEPIAAQEYALQTNRTLATGETFIRHPKHAWMIAHIDAKIMRGGAWDGILEIKIPSIQTYLRYKREGLGDYIQLQLQHYLGVTGQEWGSMYVWNAELFTGFSVDVARDQGIIDLIFEKAGEFWSWIQKGEIPPDDTVSPVVDKLPAIQAGEITSMEAAPAWEPCASDLRLASELKAEAEAIYERAKARIIELMGPIEAAEGAGLRVYHKEQPGKKSLDKEALISDLVQSREMLRRSLSVIGDYCTIFLNPKDEVVELMGLIEKQLAKPCNEKAFQKAGKPFKVFRPYFLNQKQIE